MKKTIKVIDLLNMIANEEIPKKAFYNCKEWEFDKKNNDYINSDNDFLFAYLFNYKEQALSTKLEIIEEEIKIKEIELLDIECENGRADNYYILNENGTKCYLTKHSKIIAQKLNEITKAVNYLLKKDK